MGLISGTRRLLGAALLLLAVLGAPALARTVLDLDPARQPVPLLDWGDSWMDTAGDALADNVATSPTLEWTPTREGAIYHLGSGKALWIRFTVPPAPDSERWYLEVPYSAVDRVTLYTPDSVGQWAPQSAGDSLPVASWPVPHRHPLLPLTVSAEEPRKYLLRVQNAHSFSAPLSFVSESYLSRNEQRTSLILGIYFGLAGLAAVLAALSAISLRDTAYGLYAASVALMGLTQASMTGIAGLHLWPNWPWWNDVAPIALPMLAVGSLAWFFSHVVAMPERSPRLYRLMLGIAALSVVAAVAVMLAEPSNRFRIMVPYIVLSTVAGSMSIVWAASRGDRYGIWLLVGSVPVMIGAMFPLARLAGLIPISFLTMHGMQLGIAIELPVLLVILMLRSQHRREHNRRVQGLDRIDPATGLINAPVFMERLVRMVARSQRLKFQSAVIIVDIVNIEQIRTNFDRAAADEMPLRVAGRLLSAAREIDSVARLSEHRFGVLVEGPLSTEDAASAGPRLVARCLMPFKNKPLEWVAQVRVAQALVPAASGMDTGRVLERMEALLAAVPADSKRAVFTLGS
ncbi:MAG: diguanylate cyclase [Burkholderiales bacterium]|nr:diguanylate cyclase [Burkholderiales bacterium]